MTPRDHFTQLSDADLAEALMLMLLGFCIGAVPAWLIGPPTLADGFIGSGILGLLGATVISVIAALTRPQDQ